MIIKIITEREIKDNALDDYIRKCINLGIPLDAEKLKMDGYCEFECDNGYTKSKTRYEILREIKL